VTPPDLDMPAASRRAGRFGRRLGHRENLLWGAALLHRLSGLGLAAFLPVHFLTLALVLDGGSGLDGVLRWSEVPVVKLGEGALVFLLAVHALGGLRLLAIENFAWHGGQKWLAASAAALAAILAAAFVTARF
jgi:fumarate reductase subunit D